jgi:hypothetical protein
MIQILRKNDQYNTSIFNGNLVANKPVVSGYTAAVAPYSSLFYWRGLPGVREVFRYGLIPIFIRRSKKNPPTRITII